MPPLKRRQIIAILSSEEEAEEKEEAEEAEEKAHRWRRRRRPRAFSAKVGPVFTNLLSTRGHLFCGS